LDLSRSRWIRVCCVSWTGQQEPAPISEGFGDLPPLATARISDGDIGLPAVIRSDLGMAFADEGFRRFLASCGIAHQLLTE
jgi:hypothetical protein